MIDDEEFDGLNNSNERLKRIIELKINFIIKWKRLESEDSFEKVADELIEEQKNKFIRKIKG